PEDRSVGEIPNLYKWRSVSFVSSSGDVAIVQRPSRFQDYTHFLPEAAAFGEDGIDFQCSTVVQRSEYTPQYLFRPVLAAARLDDFYGIKRSNRAMFIHKSDTPNRFTFNNDLLVAHCPNNHLLK